MSSEKEAALGPPQISASFLGYSKSSNVNGTLNLKIEHTLATAKKTGF